MLNLVILFCFVEAVIISFTAYRTRKAYSSVQQTLDGRHQGRNRPKTRADFWAGKIEGNQDRDARNCHELERRGWRAITVWECEPKNPSEMMIRLEKEVLNQDSALSNSWVA